MPTFSNGSKAPRVSRADQGLPPARSTARTLNRIPAANVPLGLGRETEYTGRGGAHWKHAIEIAVEMEVDTMNSEFGRGPHPDKGEKLLFSTLGSMIEACEEDSWWRSMEELVPIFERGKDHAAHRSPHPEDWCETLQPAVDIIRTVNSKEISNSSTARHTPSIFGDDTKAMLRECAMSSLPSVSPEIRSITRHPRVCLHP